MVATWASIEDPVCCFCSDHSMHKTSLVYGYVNSDVMLHANNGHRPHCPIAELMTQHMLTMTTSIYADLA